jgi:hypothetical protein
MFSSLPLNAENMNIEMEAANYLASSVLEILFEKFDVIINTTDENEWPSFRKGLVTLCCIQLHCQKLKMRTIDPICLLLLMPQEGIRRQETVIDLLNSLCKLKSTLPNNQTTALIGLVGLDQLTLQYLELVTSLETYISYLTQFIICHQPVDNQLTDEITNHLDKLFRENRFSSERLR